MCFIIQYFIMSAHWAVQVLSHWTLHAIYTLYWLVLKRDISWTMTFRLHCTNQFVERYDRETTDLTVRLLSATVAVNETMSRMSFAAFTARVFELKTGDYLATLHWTPFTCNVMQTDLIINWSIWTSCNFLMLSYLVTMLRSAKLLASLFRELDPKHLYWNVLQGGRFENWRT